MRIIKSFLPFCVLIVMLVTLLPSPAYAADIVLHELRSDGFTYAGNSYEHLSSRYAPSFMVRKDAYTLEIYYLEHFNTGHLHTYTYMHFDKDLQSYSIMTNDAYVLVRYSIDVEGILTYVDTFSGAYDGSTHYFSFGNVTVDALRSKFLCSTGRIVWDEPLNQLFFTKTPQVIYSGIPNITPVIQKMDLRGVLDQVLMILPAGLACLIGFLALRKGLDVLRQIFSAA